MSVIVKGRNMPRHCGECACSNYYDQIDAILCDFTEKQLDEKTWKKERHPDCPLVDLPPHGRLGDLDALYAEISNGNKAYNCIEGYDGEYQNITNVDDCLEAIKYADTVIESEGETDGR